MQYSFMAIPEDAVPRARCRAFQQALNTFASETNKVVSVWTAFEDKDLLFHPHPKSSTVEQLMEHKLLAHRRFFAKFLGTPEPPGVDILPATASVSAYWQRLRNLALPRLAFFPNQEQDWWLQEVGFFDVHRERIWIFWRRVLHTVHHRTQRAVYLCLLDRIMPTVYGPVADVSWTGADPTQTMEAAERR